MDSTDDIGNFSLKDSSEKDPRILPGGAVLCTRRHICVFFNNRDDVYRVLPVNIIVFKIIVFKNDSLTFVELEMKATGILDFGTALHNPDFVKMAEAAGLLGLTADSRIRCVRCLRKHSSTLDLR